MRELPFTIDQFLQVFEVYNRAIWPTQFVAYLLGTVVIWLVIKQGLSSEIYINRIIGLFWIWMGVIYHIIFFAVINPAAYIFGALFILQGGHSSD
ncbi:hypothetical protein Asal01_00167 [Fodinibius salicampi]|uniref:DUF6064 family protein n=1 Tax=Fodinibius salicampi TaxID=1920655 RepID=UPI003095557F